MAARVFYCGAPSDLDRVAQTDTDPVAVNLNSADAAWLRRNSMYGDELLTIHSLSQFSRTSCDGRVPTNLMLPVV
jgi:hypothetical protein